MLARYGCYAAAGIATVGVAAVCVHRHSKQRRLKQQQAIATIMSSTLTTHICDGDYEQEMVEYANNMMERRGLKLTEEEMEIMRELKTK